MTMKHVRIAVLSTVSIAAAACALGVCARHPTPELAPQASASGLTARPPGDQRRWRLLFDLGIAQPGSSAPLDVQVTGDWVATITDARPDDYDVAYELHGARIEGAGVHAAPAEVDAMRQRLEGLPFWITYRRDGAATGAHFPKDMSPDDRNLLEMVATQAQLVRTTPAADQWTATERDAAGLYLAAYQREGDHLTKHKLKYVAADGAGGTATGIDVEIDESRQDFGLDAAGGVATLEGRERFRVGMPMGQGGWLTVHAEVHLSDVRTGTAPELVGALGRTAAQLDDVPIRTQKTDPEVARAQRDRRLLAGATAAGLLDRAAAGGSDAELSSRLGALFREQPDAVDLAVARVHQQELKIVTNALATSGTDRASSALGTLAHDGSLPASTRVDALTAFALVSHPSAGALAIPGSLVDDNEGDVRRSARLICGALARAGRADHAAEAEALDQALLSRYAAARDVPTSVNLLAALGNSVGPRVLPVLYEATGASSSEVRAAAVRALRLVPGDQADQLLVTRMSGDPDAAVRSAAIFAASFRSIDPFVDPLRNVATSDPAEQVRAEAVSLLRHAHEGSPKVVQTLAWVADHDPKPGNRRVAREAIEHKGR